jgi:alpha-2-macroglobulin
VTVHAWAQDGASRVLLDCPIPAGAEAVPNDLSEEWWSWSGQQQIRDERVTQAFESLSRRGETLTFRLRATLPGSYHVLPAVAFEMYDPAKRGSSGEFQFRVTDEK